MHEILSFLELNTLVID